MATKADTAKKTVKVGEGALCFVEGAATEFVFKDKQGSDAPGMDMLAYSGGVIPNHWYWDNLIIDLSGMSLPKGRLPILKDHNTDQVIGHAGRPTIDDNGLHVNDVKFMQTPHANEFVQNSKDGMPYQASIYAKPSKIQRVAENEEVTVNGHVMKGPGTVWRKSALKEASVTLFGYDPNTSSKAFKEGDQVELSFEEVPSAIVPAKTSEEGDTMPTKITADMFKESDPEGYKALCEGIEKHVKEQFKADLDAKDAALASVTTKLSDMSSSVKEMEKKFVAIAEKEMAFTAKNIVAQELSGSSLPARLHDKVSVDYNAFVEGGKLDTEKFTAAVKAEVKDWEDRIKDSMSTAPIIGGGTPPATPGNPDKFSEEDGVKAATALLKGFGINVPTA